MTRLWIAMLSVCAAISLFLSGCFDTDFVDETQSASVVNTVSPHTLYLQASEKIASENSLTMYIGTFKTISVESQSFTEASQQHLTYQFDTEGSLLQAAMDETLRLGNNTVEISEAYADGIGYLTINGSTFTAPLTGEECRMRYAPAILFDPEIYSSIQSTHYGNTACISFSQPNRPEIWATPENATFLDASGYAVIDAHGTLTESTYTVSYTLENSNVTETIRVVISPTADSIILPDTAETYASLEYLDAPKILEKACGYLLQARQIDANFSKKLACQAFAIDLTQTTSISMSGIGDTFSALIETDVYQINQSRGGEITELQQSERFKNGTYSLATNGSRPIENASVDYPTMLKYCQDLLVESILLPSYITSASVSESANTYRITLYASEAFAEVICADACDTLYNDPTLLNTLASSYSTDLVECYLDVEKSTGLPLASGVRYVGVHTIEGISYQLTAQINQTYQYP